MLAETNVLTAVLAVFSAIGEWIVEFIPSLLSMFYAPETGLTVLGIMAIAALGVSIVFLCIGVIQSFFHWRG